MMWHVAILYCHLVCGEGETKSPYISYTGKKRPKNKRLGHQKVHGKAIWKPGISEIAKASSAIAPGPHKGYYSAPHELPASRVNVLMHIRLLLNP